MGPYDSVEMRGHCTRMSVSSERTVPATQTQWQTSVSGRTMPARPRPSRPVATSGVRREGSAGPLRPQSPGGGRSSTEANPLIGAERSSRPESLSAAGVGECETGWSSRRTCVVQAASERHGLVMVGPLATRTLVTLLFESDRCGVMPDRGCHWRSRPDQPRLAQSLRRGTQCSGARACLDDRRSRARSGRRHNGVV